MNQGQVNEAFVQRIEQLEPHLFHRVMAEIQVAVLSQQLEAQDDGPDEVDDESPAD